MSHGGIPGSAGDGAHLDALGILLAACASVPLLAWRRAPMGVFALTAAASALLAGLGYPLGLPLGPTAALYLLAASREDGHPWTPRTSAVVVGLLVAYLGATAAAQESFPTSELLHTGLAWAVAWFAGERTRLRHEHVAELAERTRRAERDAERERLLAVAEERARIARDLHDSAGHAINVIAVRAGAARMRHGQDPDRSLLALEAIEEVARQTGDEIDQIVGTLREGGDANGIVEPPPGLASLDTLIADHDATGLDVTVEAATAPRPLRGVVDQAAYRILQEALTNAARHGAGSARIELAFDDEAFELTVTNPVPDGGPPRTNRGHGVIGMRERATLVGGNLDAGRDNGAFRLRARIPYGGHDA
ncbi:MAG: histidine kinase [Solirubrobacterales bacterium]|nr:histidine kinase [Solirubrobacterales bacterium]